jgi:RluA family pseudouridine synthase
MKYDLKLTTEIDSRSEGKTLIKAISERFSYHETDYWLEKIKSGQILLNNEIAHSDIVLKSQDILEFTVKNFEEPDIDCSYNMIFSNDYLMIVNKPAGLPVHSTRRFFRQTLVALLRKDMGFNDINPLQRLDRETSGIMILTRISRVPKRFHRRAKKYLQKKYYLAIVRNSVHWQNLTVAAPLSECLQPPVRYKMITSPEGKESRTDFFCIASTSDYSLLLARLDSGRKHQIRAHLEILGHPLIGEKLYFRDAYFFLRRCEDKLNNDDWQKLGAKNHLLHAWAVKTNFPELGARTFFAEQFSDEFTSYLKIFPDWRARALQIIFSDS